jgi:uncharacterized alkaline shock family protein YloU
MRSDSSGQGDRQRGGGGGAGRTQMIGRPEAAPVALETAQGNTRISPDVIAKIAGLAARDIPGVYSMGSGVARRIGQLRAMIPGGSQAASQGVSVEVGEKQTAIDLNLVTWYGQSIVDISDAVRGSVIGQVEGMTGLKVVEVNIQVDDIHVESPQDSQQQQQSRGQ